MNNQEIQNELLQVQKEISELPINNQSTPLSGV